MTLEPPTHERTDKDKQTHDPDFSGLYPKFANALQHGYTQDEIDESNIMVEFWRDKLQSKSGDTIRLEVIPCDSKDHKKINALEGYANDKVDYYKNEVPPEFLKNWKDNGAFVHGIAVLCGEIKSGPYKGCYFNMIDCDNKVATQMMQKVLGCKSTSELAALTLTESYEDSAFKLHLYIITFDRPLLKRHRNESIGDDLPKLEIYGDRHASIVSNSWKYNRLGQLRQVKILGTDKVMVYDGKQALQLERDIDAALREYGLAYLPDGYTSNTSDTEWNPDRPVKKSKYVEDMKDEDFRVYSGGNKQGYLLSKMNSLIARNYSTTPLSIIKKWCWDINEHYIIPPIVSEKEFEIKWKNAVKFIINDDAYDDEAIKLMRELEELGIKPSDYIDEKTLTESVKLLRQMIHSDEFDEENNNAKAKMKIETVEVEEACEQLENNFEFKTIRDTRQVLFYNGKVYERNGEGKILEELEWTQRAQRGRLVNLKRLVGETKDLIDKRHKAGKDNFELAKYLYVASDALWTENHKRIMRVRRAFGAEVVYKISNTNLVDIEQFNVDPNIIILNNGVLRLVKKVDDLSWTLTDHSPAINSMNMFPVDYNPKATCPNFIKFLTQICKYNPKLYKNIIKMLGYCIYQSCEYQVAFMLWGEGDNGKSIILKVIQALLGLENISNVALHELCDGDKFFPAELFGKTANIYADLPFKAVKNTSIFKNSVAGDRIGGQFKNQPIFYFEPHATHVYSTNRLPKSDDDTYGWFKRWVLLHFKIIMPKYLQDRQFIKKVTTPEELSGILNLALAGLKLLMRDGGFDTGSLYEVKKEYERQSSLVKELIDDNYDVNVGKKDDPDYCVDTDQIHTEWINFLNKDDRKQYIKNEIVDSGIKDRDIDLTKDLDKWIAFGLLGRELAGMGIEHKRRYNKETGEKIYYYAGLKSKVEKTIKEGW